MFLQRVKFSHIIYYFILIFMACIEIRARFIKSYVILMRSIVKIQSTCFQMTSTFYFGEKGHKHRGIFKLFVHPKNNKINNKIH